MNIKPEIARQQGHHGKKGGRPKLSIPKEAQRERKDETPEEEKRRLANRASYHRNKWKKLPQEPKARKLESWETWKERFEKERAEGKFKKALEMAFNRRARARRLEEDTKEIDELIEAAKAALHDQQEKERKERRDRIESEKARKLAALKAWEAELTETRRREAAEEKEAERVRIERRAVFFRNDGSQA